MCVDVLVASPDGPKELSQMVQCRGGGEDEHCKGIGINTVIQTGQQKNKSSTLLSHDHDRSTYGLDLGILHLSYSSHLQEEHLLKSTKNDRNGE